jgi:hypothetical protein
MTNVDPGAAVPYNKYVKKEVVYDLMRGGSGTPWENRGEFGPVGAFVRSATRALFKPGLLFDHIRGTTVTSDARSFLWVCTGCWGASVLIHCVIAYFLIDAETYNVDTYTYVIATVIKTAVSAVWAFLMFRFLSGLYHKLVTTEIKQPVPATLTYNVVAYAMGPSIFAPIPLIGPPFAAIGIFVSMIAAGRKRLYVTWRAAVIDALIPFAAAVVLTMVLYFVGRILLRQVFDPIEEIPKIPSRNSLM